jgi:transposase
MKGKEVSEDLCWVIVRMEPLLSRGDIETYTGVSKRNIRRILARWRSTGEVKARKDRRLRGRPRHLTSDDVAVSTGSLNFVSLLRKFKFIHGSLNRHCDTYLDEIQEGLLETCGVEASVTNIWRAMRRSGYTMKKVSPFAEYAVTAHKVCE